MRRIILGAAAFAATGLASTPAGASGFLAARFGGEHGHPTTSNPTAIYYNPAGLALGETYSKKVGDAAGWNFRLYLDGAFAFRTVQYERPAEAIDNLGEQPGTPEDAVDANSGKAELSNFLASPFAAITTDFGLENFGAGLALYVPFGGVAEWKGNDAYENNETYPGAQDGVQRWWTMDGRIQAMYITAGAAYRIPDWRLSIGAGLNLIESTVNTVRARNADGSDDMIAGDGTLKEGRSFIDVDGWNVGLGAGVIWEPIEKVWLGVSYQSQPGFGENELDGTLSNALGTSPVAVTDVELQQELPDLWRFGVRLQPDDQWEFRASAEWVNWSKFERQCILVKDDPDRNCSLNENGSVADDGAAVTQNIQRNWDDAFGIRGGASYWFSPAVEGYVGIGYDGNAVPDETLDPALIDMGKWTFALGGEFSLTERFLFATTLTAVVYNERTTEVGDVTNYVPPSAQPNSAGRYSQFITVLDVYGQYTF